VFSPIVLDAHNPGPMTGAGNHTYLIVGADRTAALIDAGVGDSRHLEALAASLDEQHARLAYVLVTHAHSDHASGARAIAAAHGAAFLKRAWPERDSRYGVAWRALADGQTIDVGGEILTAIHTPGHSPDHVVFWHAASSTVFSGDLVIQGGSVMIDWSHGGNMAEYLASLARVRALAVRTMLPAHGPSISNPTAVLTEYLEHRLTRERQVVAALEAGLDTVPAIAESIYDGLPAPALASAARENVRAHLEKLRDEGRALEDLGRWRAAGASS
jgi:hydroxyacylglutathione hydrolase